MHQLGYGIDVWARWDSAFFLRIAEHGYDGTSAAFYPLYPGIVAVVGWVLAGQYVLAGVLVSLAACLGAFVLLYRLSEARLGAGRRPACRRLPRDLPDGAVPRRGLQRVALPAARGRGVRARRARTLSGGRRGSGARDPHPRDRCRAAAGAGRDGLAAQARPARARGGAADRRRVPARPVASGRRPVGVLGRPGPLAPPPLVGRAARRDLGRSARPLGADAVGGRADARLRGKHRRRRRARALRRAHRRRVEAGRERPTGSSRRSASRSR